MPSITRKTDKGLPQYHDTDQSDVFKPIDAKEVQNYIHAYQYGNIFQSVAVVYPLIIKEKIL